MRKIFFLIFISFSLQGISQGLQFQGYGVLMEERSSYSVFVNQIPQFQKQLSVDFDIAFDDINSFGYIFLLRDKDTRIEYSLIYNYDEGKNGLLKFNAEGKGNLITMELDNNLLKNRTWLHFSCTFFLDEDSLQVSVNNKIYTTTKVNLPKELSPQLFFGKNENSVDVSAFSIRNLSIGNKKREYNFKFKESEGEDVHDDDGKVVGHISNPRWLINNSYHWKNHYTYKSQTASGVNYLESTQNVYFFNKDSILSFDLRTHTASSKKYLNKLPIDMRLGMSFFTDKDQLYVYEVCDYAGLDFGNTVAYLEMKDNKWISSKSKALPVQLHHHAGFFDSTENRYIIFGGFGNQRYNQEFLSYSISANKWDTLSFSGDKIMPRYFQGIAKNKNKLYIFGGLGNESGDQTVGRHNFYDLHEVDLNEKKIVKRWEIDWKGKHVVPARNMVMLNDSSFYALCYPEYEPNTSLQLYKFSISDGTYQILGDSIFFRSDKIATNANLYYNHLLNEFYCTVQVFEDDGSSVTQLYSLAYPAVTKADLTLYSRSENHFKWWLILIPSIGCLFIFLFGIYKRSKNKQKDQNAVLLPTKISLNDIESPTNNKNSIYLFGEFTVYDRKGKDITYMFSVRLKNTFLLILQHSTANGISSQLLSKLLWPKKEEYSVKNLRGVTINQLRKILIELDGIELLFDKGDYKIIMSNDCYCDFNQFIHLIGSDADNSEQINDIKNILSRGKFLKSIEDALLDPFKEYVKTKIVSILPIYINDSFKAENYLRALQLSEILLVADPLNEKALFRQVQAFYNLKQVTEAKMKYALFASEYRQKMDKEYPTSFSEILYDKTI